MAGGNTSCEYLIIHGLVPQPDNDVAGIGVILAFMISAYITLAIVLYAYLQGYIDHTLLRPVDIYVHRRSARNAYREDEWYIAIRQCTLAFSDQQIVTGIAALIAGFIGFANSMSVYHFQIVMYLGWMSSSVHLSALTMLSSFMQERRALMGWRITGMIVMFVLLLVALFPTSSNMWAVDNTDTSDNSPETGWAVPAKCFWFKYYGNGINADGPLGLVLIIVSYLWKVGGLFRSSRRAFRIWIRGPVEYRLEKLVRSDARRMRGRRSRINMLRYQLSMGVYVTVFANFEFFSSFAASLWLSMLGLIWGTLQIAVPRKQNSWWNYQENTWTFGQITPLVLLIQPLGAVLEHVGEGAKQRKEKEQAKHCARREQNGEQEQQQQHDDEEGQQDTELEKSRLRARNRYLRTPSIARSAQNLSEVFAELDPKRPVDRPIGDLLGHQRLLYSSFYFKSLICWMQIAAIGISIVVMIEDALWIGYYSSANWLLIGLAISVFIGASFAWQVVNMPFSKIFR